MAETSFTGKKTTCGLKAHVYRQKNRHVRCRHAFQSNKMDSSAHFDQGSSLSTKYTDPFSNTLSSVGQQPAPDPALDFRCCMAAQRSLPGNEVQQAAHPHFVVPKNSCCPNAEHFCLSPRKRSACDKAAPVGLDLQRSAAIEPPCGVCRIVYRIDMNETICWGLKHCHGAVMCGVECNVSSVLEGSNHQCHL